MTMYLLNDTQATPEPTGPVAVEGVEVSSLPDTGSGGGDTNDVAFGLLLALLFAGMIAAGYGAAAWVRGR